MHVPNLFFVKKARNWQPLWLRLGYHLNTLDFNRPELDGLPYCPVNDVIIRAKSAHNKIISLYGEQNLFRNHIVPTLMVAFAENRCQVAV